MIALPFSEEAWQGDKILIYLLIKLSKEVTYLRETGPFRTILLIQKQGEITVTSQVMHEFNYLEHLISENFQLRSRVPHAYVTQRVSSYSYERTSLLRTACFDARGAL